VLSKADTRQLPAEARCFRLRRFYLVVGVVSAVFCSVTGAISTVVAYWNIDGSFPRPKLNALILGIFWSGFALLSLWVVLAYFRECLFLASKSVVQHGVFRSRTIDVDGVTRIKWRTWPVGGSIVVQTHSEKATIYLDNFTTEDRGRIIRFFRETFASEIQDNPLRFEDFARPGK
jgi:hypothetical protein